MKKPTIIDKILSLLSDEKTLNLEYIYKQLTEHSHASIRGNLNRYITRPDAKIKRVRRGVYSVVEIIKVEKDDNKTKLQYVNKYFCNNKIASFFYKDCTISNSVDIEEGIYTNVTTYNSCNNMNSVAINADARNILKRLKSNFFDCIITDSPYRKQSGGNKAKNAPKGILSANDGKIFKENSITFSEWIPDVYRILKEQSHAYFFVDAGNMRDLLNTLNDVGFKIHNIITWDKGNATPNRWYMQSAEFIVFARKGKAKAIKNKGSKNIMRIPNIIGNKIHPTEKPLELIEKLLLNSSNEGDWILEPFAGSFVEHIAALKNNRKIFSIEKDMAFYKRGINRITNYIKNGTDRIIDCVQYKTVV